jgi:hypothetical protein
MKRKAFQIVLFTNTGFWLLSAFMYMIQNNEFTNLWFARIFLATVCFGFGALLEKKDSAT